MRRSTVAYLDEPRPHIETPWQDPQRSPFGVGGCSEVIMVMSRQSSVRNLTSPGDSGSVKNLTSPETPAARP